MDGKGEPEVEEQLFLHFSYSRIPLFYRSIDSEWRGCESDLSASSFDRDGGGNVRGMIRPLAVSDARHWIHRKGRGQLKYGLNAVVSQQYKRIVRHDKIFPLIRQRRFTMTRTAFLLSALIGVGLAIGASSAMADSAASGKVCGGIGGIPCAAGEWCDPTPGQCGVADASGVCKKVGTVCTDQHLPVCGCDKKSYDNDCRRVVAKIGLDHAGACSESK